MRPIFADLMDAFSNPCKKFFHYCACRSGAHDGDPRKIFSPIDVVLIRRSRF